MRCSTCKTDKPEAEFYRNKATKRGYDSKCKSCDREIDYRRRKAYSIHKQCLAHLGGVCARCGFDDIRALQIDHINGGGKKEIQSFGSQWRKYYRHVLADTTGKYQVLCANCNWIKRTTNKEGVR